MKGPFLQVLGIFAIPSAVVTEMRGIFFYSCSFSQNKKETDKQMAEVWTDLGDSVEVLWKILSSKVRGKQHGNTLCSNETVTADRVTWSSGNWTVKLGVNTIQCASRGPEVYEININLYWGIPHDSICYLLYL